MIKSIFPSGKYISVQNAAPITPTIYNYNYGSQPTGAQAFSGQIRYSTSNQCLEIFDGNMWHQWHSNVANVGLNQNAERLLDWVQEKIADEEKLKLLMEKNPGLKDLYEKFEMMKVMVTEQEKHGV